MKSTAIKGALWATPEEKMQDTPLAFAVLLSVVVVVLIVSMVSQMKLSSIEKIVRQVSLVKVEEKVEKIIQEKNEPQPEQDNKQSTEIAKSKPVESKPLKNELNQSTQNTPTVVGAHLKLTRCAR